MKQIWSKYQGSHNSIYLVPIGDVHLGSKYFEYSFLDKVFKFIDAHRDRCRLILMGDMIELATKTSVGRAVYDEEYHTHKQFEEWVRLFSPYADIIDAVLVGNHEERIIKDTSFEIVQEFCHRIGRIDAYGGFSCVVNVVLGKTLYSVFAWHGSGNSTTIAGAINSLNKMRERCVAHIYLMGHTHKLFSFPGSIKIPSPDGSETLEIEQLLVNTGSALDYGGYSEQKGLPIVKRGFGAVELFADRRKAVFHCIDDLI